MSVGSPSAYLLWAILSCIFLTFLMLHLWAYDRFNCLKWSGGRQPGAFKRVMTYSYLGTVPLLVVFSVAITVIKFSEGYFVSPSGKVVPKPLNLWRPKNQHWLLPLYFILSIAWSLELVTHLEELAFWLFLLHQGPGKREWFYSWEFRAWYIGCTAAILGMPLTTLITRRDLETCQAYIFLVGSLAGTSTTICFLYVLFRFPAFIRHVKAEGAEPDVVVRLATFYQLNRIRVMFRFLFTIPLLIIAVDGIHPPFIAVANAFASDFLLMMGGIGCFVSSAITLLIFFPRSFTREAGYRAKMHTPQNSGKVVSASSPTQYYHDGSGPKQSLEGSLPSMAMHTFRRSTSHNVQARHSLERVLSPGYESDTESEARTSHTMPVASPGTSGRYRTMSVSQLDPRWQQLQVEASVGQQSYEQRLPLQRNIYMTTSSPPLPRQAPREVHSSLQLHPYVLHFTSPIDLVDLPDTNPNAAFPHP